MHFGGSTSGNGLMEKGFDAKVAKKGATFRDVRRKWILFPFGLREGQSEIDEGRGDSSDRCVAEEARWRGAVD